ncbi:helix-turn-helix domain-containing protein [Prauserella oleivorans]|uniref:Helix-turn-helix domain-containing protein n=1 Tax=Prauserella oleivorans TaxID=1478153 RepID=A0ABW5W563_9PSEU
MGGTAFSAALRAAISASGLGLDRIQARLQERGITVSVTALSYWQSGKRQPERQSSISAVRALEEILEVPPGSLLGRLPSPRPRGSTSRRRQDEGVRPLSLDDPPDLTLVGLHDRCEVAENGRQSAVTSRAVFRASADGQDRWLLAYRQDGPGAPAPTLRALRNCTVGRVEADAEHGLTLAELLFGRSIAHGETHLVEYSLAYEHAPGPHCRKSHFREFWQPIPEYLLEVHFGAGTAPERCWQYAHPGEPGAAESKDLKLDDGNSVHAVALDFGPGVFGIAWA